MDFDSIIKWITETLPAILSRWFDAFVAFVKPTWDKTVEVVSAWFEISVAFFKQAWENLPALMADWGAAIAVFLKGLRTELSGILPQSVMQALEPVPDWALFIVLLLVVLVLLVFIVRRMFTGPKEEEKHLKSVESPEVPTLGDPLPPEGDTDDHVREDADDHRADVPDIPDPERHERVVPFSATQEVMEPNDLDERLQPPDEPGERQEIGPAELQTRLREQLGIDSSQGDPVAADQTAAPEKPDDNLDDAKSDDLVGGDAEQNVSESLNRIREFRREKENRSASLNITGIGDETDTSAPKVVSPPPELPPQGPSPHEAARARSSKEEGISEPKMDVPSSEPTLPEIEEILTEPHFGNSAKTQQSDPRSPEPSKPAADENVINLGSVEPEPEPEPELTSTAESSPSPSDQPQTAAENDISGAPVDANSGESEPADDEPPAMAPEQEPVSPAPDTSVPAPTGPLLATLARLEEDLRVNERLASQNPASAQIQRDVAVSMSRLADALVGAGDLLNAITRFEQSLAISERLAEQNPASTEALRDVAVSLNRLGDALVMKGDIEVAGAQYEIGLKVSQRLAEQSPANAQAQRDVWISLNRMGDLRAKAGDIADATAHFETGWQISQRLADVNPANVEAQRDLIVSCAKLGEMSPGQGWWAKGFSVCERLAAECKLSPQDSWMLEYLRRRSGSDTAV